MCGFEAVSVGVPLSVPGGRSTSAGGMAIQEASKPHIYHI